MSEQRLIYIAQQFEQQRNSAESALAIAQVDLRLERETVAQLQRQVADLQVEIAELTAVEVAEIAPDSENPDLHLVAAE